MKSSEIRTAFLDFFQSNGHSVVRSSSLVPANDPTLYFVNAGMVQFKDVFTGEEHRNYTRACSSQKCLRVSGKHNDLETVGRTPKHHTFFEMLGNFSFGDYFKEDAIKFAWDFLTNVVALDGDRMVATVFCGEDGVPGDDEAFAIWRDVVGLPEERIHRLGKEDNFWSMGDTGPCGPCTEIHLIPDTSVSMKDALAAGGPAEDDRWIEVWNLVFMQFNRQAGKVEPLAQTGVDTGMGLERLTALKNGLSSTYDTDLLLPVIHKVADLAGIAYGKDSEKDISLRVIADHARATAFCIADGVFPEKGGREYVLRRIMRRAIRHGKLIGFEDNFFEQACATVVTQMAEAYPELSERSEVIAKLVDAEETAFRRTLGRGLQKLNKAISAAQKSNEKTLTNAFVGDLYATDGFPIDLTRLIAEESSLTVDEAAAQQWVVDTHGAGDSKVGGEAIAKIYKQLSDELPPTSFVGYEHHAGGSEILAMVSDGAKTTSADKGTRVDVVVRETPFYARSGGQVGDRGTIEGDGFTIDVEDTTKPGGQIWVHHGVVKKGTAANGKVTLTVDQTRRQAIRLNHSATHLLHHALRSTLGSHVAQKGSEVNPDYLRFDFSHFEALTADEITAIETQVDQAIRGNFVAKTEVMDFESAKQTGAMALFGEKYGDDVRVVTIGPDSIELCGGTHVQRSGDIGSFRIVSEESLALGVRRIVAKTGAGALAHNQAGEAILKRGAALLGVGPQDFDQRITGLFEQLKAQERELSKLKRQLATGGGGAAQDTVSEIDGIKLLAKAVPVAEPKTLREAADTLLDRLGSGVVVLGGEHEGTARLIVKVTKDLTKRVHAGKLVGELATIIGGRGGGRPDMAQAGGPAVDQLEACLTAASATLSKALSADS